jgi:hypothetical protein
MQLGTPFRLEGPFKVARTRFVYDDHGRAAVAMGTARGLRRRRTGAENKRGTLGEGRNER